MRTKDWDFFKENKDNELTYQRSTRAEGNDMA